MGRWTDQLWGWTLLHDNEVHRGDGLLNRHTVYLLRDEW